MEMKLSPSPQSKDAVPVPVDAGQPALSPVPDLFLPCPGDRVLVQRTNYIKFTGTARWTGTEWIFRVAYHDNKSAWVRETPEEGTYEELEDQPSEEPNKAVSGTARPISG